MQTKIQGCSNRAQYYNSRNCNDLMTRENEPLLEAADLISSCVQQVSKVDQPAHLETGKEQKPNTGKENTPKTLNHHSSCFSPRWDLITTIRFALICGM